MPFVDLTLFSVDLSVLHRDEKEDEPIETATMLLREHKIGIKCSTITPNVC